MSVGAAATGCLSPKTTISLLGAGAPGSAGGLSADIVCGIVFGAPRHRGLEISLWMQVLRFLESGWVLVKGYLDTELAPFNVRELVDSERHLYSSPELLRLCNLVVC